MSNANTLACHCYSLIVVSFVILISIFIFYAFIGVLYPIQDLGTTKGS